METALGKQLRDIDALLEEQSAGRYPFVEDVYAPKRIKRSSKASLKQVGYFGGFDEPAPPPRIKIYYIDKDLELDRNRLFHLLLAAVIFGLSVGLTAISLVFGVLSHVIPWYFWTTPLLGSFGVALGILLNLRHKEAAIWRAKTR